MFSSHYNGYGVLARADTEHFSRGQEPRDNFVFREGGGTEALFRELYYVNLINLNSPSPLDPSMIGTFSINCLTVSKLSIIYFPSVPMSVTFYLCPYINN